MKAFDRLDAETRAAITARVEFRKKRFLELMHCGHAKRDTILLVGEKPAPDAPDDPTFHYTPFGAEHHSSLWLNLQLHSGGIPEEWLSWVNAYDMHGEPTSRSVLCKPWKTIIALGTKARDWVQGGEQKFSHGAVHHPQYHKRFHSGTEYPLINLIRIERSL